MSQYTDADESVEEPEPTEEPQSKGVRQRMKQLEEEAEAGRQAQRELAFRKAGVNLDDEDPKVRFFVDKYDGKVEPEAISKLATDLGIVAPPAPVTPPAEQEGLARMTQVAAGGAAPPAVTDWVAEINKGQTTAEVKAVLAKAQAAQT